MEKLYSSFLRPLASVEDADGAAIALALKKEVGPVSIASDNAAAITSIRKLSRGAPPRSEIEARIKAAMVGSEGEVGILWVRGHCGISCKEIANHLANFYSGMGPSVLDDRVATEEGL